MPRASTWESWRYSTCCSYPGHRLIGAIRGTLLRFRCLLALASPHFIKYTRSSRRVACCWKQRSGRRSRRMESVPESQFVESAVEWKNGALAMAGCPLLPLSRLAKILYAKNQPTGAMVHAAYVGEWITSRFSVNGLTYQNAIDGLAVKRGEDKSWTLLDRINVFSPSAQNSNSGRSLYAPCGTLAAVGVNRRTGDVSVLAVHTILEAGRIVQTGSA